MSKQVQDWFSPWYGKDVGDVLYEFQLENTYDTLENFPEETIVSNEFVANRCRIWYDTATRKVTLITVG